MDLRRAELEKKLGAIAELERRKSEAPLYFFQPIPKVSPFFSHKANIRIFAGGNRSGKTEHGCAEDAAFALGYRPWVLREMGLPLPNPWWKRPESLPEAAICFTGAGVRVPVPNTGVVVTGLSMRQGVGQTLAVKLRKLLGEAIETEHISHAGTPADMILKNGSKIHFLSDEQPALAFESFAVHWFHCDEPVRRRVFTGLRRAGVDNYARGWLSFTPLGANAHWIWKDLYSKADDKKVAVWTCSIFDNTYLPAEAVKDFAEDPAIAEVEKEARLYGRFQHLLDRVYPQFDPDVHVVDDFAIPHDWYTGMAVDPHSARPFAIVYFAVAPRGDIYIFKEWPTSDFTKIRRDSRDVRAYAMLLRDLDGDREISVRLADPNSAPRRDVTRGQYVSSWVDLFAPYGIHLNTNLNDRLDYGEGCVRQLLSYNAKEPITAANRPKLYVFASCLNTTAALSFYTIKTKQNADDGLKDEERSEDYKDFADVVRYIAVSGAARAALDDSPSYMPSFSEGDDDDLPTYAV